MLREGKRALPRLMPKAGPRSGKSLRRPAKRLSSLNLTYARFLLESPGLKSPGRELIGRLEYQKRSLNQCRFSASLGPGGALHLVYGPSRSVLRTRIFVWRSLAPPLGSRKEAPTLRDIPQESCCKLSASDA